MTKPDVVAGVVAAVAVAAIAAPAGSPRRSARGSDGLDVVRAYNSRSIGSPGWRRVTMTMRSGDVVTRQFSVLNVWRERSGRVDTAFFLEQPAGLRGTAYLQTEGAHEPHPDGEPGLAVSLFLPVGGRRVLSLAPDSLDEGLLGCDFTYEDLRWRLPLRNRRYALTGETELRGEASWVVRAERRSGSGDHSRWARVTYYLGRTSGLLRRAEFYAAAGDHEPAKVLAVPEVRMIDGVWTPVRMLMRGAAGRSTEIRLLAARFNLQRTDLDWLSPDALPDLARHLASAGLGPSGPREVR